MRKSDIELKFLADIPVDIGNVCKLHVPTLREVIEMGESEYYRLLSSLLVKKDQIEIDELLEASNMEVVYTICYHDKEFLETFQKASRFIFREDISMSPEELGLFFYFGDLEEKRFLNDRNFDWIQSLVVISNNINVEEDEYNPANEEARKLVEEIKKAKAEISKNKKQISSLSSKISGVAWKSNSVNIFNVFDLNIYQFYDALLRLEQVDNYQFTLTGIYTGNVDSKKVKIDNLHWTKKIEH